MKSYASLIIILLLRLQPVAGQSASVVIGGRSSGMGNASAALKDSWAVYNNPAGSAKLATFSFNTVCAVNTALPGADRIAAAFVIPTKAGTFLAGAFKFGDDVYSEQLVSAGYSHTLGLASMGARVDYIQYRAEGFDPSVAVGLTIGTVADITNTLSLGGYVANVNRPKLPNGQALPVRMATGLVFRPTDKVVICAEVDKDVDFKPTFKGGVELSPLKKFKVRTGLNIYPNLAFAGIGFNSWRLAFDYSLSYSTSLLLSHQAALSFVSKQKENKK